MILDGQAPGAIARAAQTLRAGDLLGLPTETVYGLAADADNAQAIAKIFSAKGRPSDHPLIVHVLNETSVAHFAQAVPDFAHALMQAFWPGPLTLILPRRPGVAGAAAGGQNSIGLRCPSHSVAQAPDAPAPRASGTLESHYAPSAKVRLMDAPALQQAIDVLGSELDRSAKSTAGGPRIAVYARAPLKSRSGQVLIRRMPDDAAVTAQQLFAVLREFDAQGVQLIWIETLPDTPEWDGVRDRLQRASAN